jgi:tryptophan 2,3-dioxygenase
MTATVTYWDYLQLNSLLESQGGVDGTDDNLSEDELHFIIVHQVFELWLKLILRELHMARDQMIAGRVDERNIPHVVRHLRRVNEILRLSIDGFDVLETLTPQDFLAFRGKLGTSSGFQSYQMRVLELILGLDPAERARYTQVADPIRELEEIALASPTGGNAVIALRQAKSQPSLKSALMNWLSRTPIQGSRPDDTGDDDVIQGFVREYRQCLQEREPELTHDFDAFLSPPATALETADVPVRSRVALLFIESYRDLPLLTWPYLLIETVVELEELLVLWRARHARMVERIIGRRIGTGGSPGVKYLDATTQYRIFHEFWTVRTLLVPRANCPTLQRPEIYELLGNFILPRKGNST